MCGRMVVVVSVIGVQRWRWFMHRCVDVQPSERPQGATKALKRALLRRRCSAKLPSCELSNSDGDDRNRSVLNRRFPVRCLAASELQDGKESIRQVENKVDQHCTGKRGYEARLTAAFAALCRACVVVRELGQRVLVDVQKTQKRGPLFSPRL